MTVNEVLSLSRKGELKSLGLADDLEALVGYLNLGLIELYKKFQLNVKEEIIALEEGKTIYDMPADCMWIIAAYGETSETELLGKVKILPINEEDNPESINTISWNQIQVPITTSGAYVSIIYVAAPDKLFTVDDLAETVPVPPQMIEPLLFYIAYKGHSTIDSGVRTEDSVHYQGFLAACDEIKANGMYNTDDLNMNNRIADGGFV